MFRFCRHPKPTNAGSRLHTIRQGRYRDDGTIELYEVETVDVQDKINSHRYECDLTRIISQLRSGDTSVVNRNVPFYGDVSSMPTNYADILNSLSDAQYSFDRLSPDIKKVFDNDFNKWFASVGSPDWYVRMGMVKPVSKDVVKQPIKDVKEEVKSE